MTPPCRVFPASQLQKEIQINEFEKRRKGGKIDLTACELFSMVQYNCQIDRPDLPESPVRCWPVPRCFRRCKDKKGPFMVETTAWEGRQEEDAKGEVVASIEGVQGNWTTGWRDKT